MIQKEGSLRRMTAAFVVFHGGRISKQSLITFYIVIRQPNASGLLFSHKNVQLQKYVMEKRVEIKREREKRKQ